MLIDFSIQNFLSIREKQTLSFQADKRNDHLEEYYVEKIGNMRLLKAALILGSNASGKSNILKSLNFLRDLILNPKQSKSESTGCIPFMLDEKSAKENTIFEINFIHQSQTYYYKIEINERCIVNEVLKTSKAGKCIISRSTDEKLQTASIKVGSNYPLNKDSLTALSLNTLWNNTLIGGYLKTNIESEHLRNVHEWFSTYLHKLIFPNENLTQYISHKIHIGCIDKTSLVPLMRQADFNISDIDVSKVNEKSLEVRLSHTGMMTLPFSLESLGTQRYFGLAGILYLMTKSGNAYMIDELDESLHPDLYIHFLLSFAVNTHGSQLIATTHNRELLNNRDIFRNDMIHFTNRNESLNTELYRLSDFGTNVIRDTSNILNAYKAGRLGGIPNLGDYYINI